MHRKIFFKAVTLLFDLAIIALLLSKILDWQFALIYFGLSLQIYAWGGGYD